ncbi:hypothetical protein OC498_08570 [Acinetobacter bohemicus]|uniref:hypothetical protein n=1 Tax=Acinetobacter TaxID=469 RepID=UPI00209B8FD3|nr:MULTISPECIES: hypothetical protein [Acinetobacter]MCO8042653.1 hypothetical protein [Acinetobacter sp. S4400-12]MCU7224957.1 hypothetical protein [Acinetobacter bohemicus]MDM1782136.1 hypothetical protein [Acinetobacter indicus]
MQELIEQISQQQLVEIIILLEDDKKLEAIHYIRSHTPLDEIQARQLIDEIVREHDLALQRDPNDTIGPRFTEDEDMQLLTPPLELPKHPQLSISKEQEVAAQRVPETTPTQQIKKKIWMTAAAIVLLIILVWIIL